MTQYVWDRALGLPIERPKCKWHPVVVLIRILKDDSFITERY